MIQTPLPTLIDEIALREPDALFLEYPKSSTDLREGLRTVTYKQLANAINGVAHQVIEDIGSSQSFETLAYLGPGDARYIFVFVAAIKTGHKIFLTSPRNSSAAHASLLSELGCDKVLTTNPPPPALRDVFAQSKVHVLYIPEMAELLSTTYPAFPYEKDPLSAKDDEVWACHTSGTTSMPKPRIYSHHFNACVVNNITLPPPEGYTSLQAAMAHNRSLLLLPLFHPAGVQFGILNAVYNRTVNVLPPPMAPPSVGGLLEMLEHTTVDWAVMAPATLEALAKNEAHLDRVAANLSMIVFSGGSLPRPLGDVIATKIKLCSFLGSSETAGYPQIYREGFDFVKDWHYHCIHPAAGVEFEPRAGSTYELVLKSSKTAAPYQPVFKLFPDMQQYRTKDIFTQHPKWSNTWTYASRSDDVIVFLNGEKTNPIGFEAHVSQHPEISSVIVFGKQRWEPGILIELNDRKPLNVAERAAAIQRIWPVVQTANRDAPAYARVSPSHILFVDPGKPLQRTAKDTVKRESSLQLYSKQIDRLYKDAEEISRHLKDGEALVDANNLDDLICAIQEEVRKMSACSEAVNPDTYFFSLGIDSLQVLRLVRQLRQRLSTVELQPSTIYLNPTARSLAKAMQYLHLEGHTDRRERDKDRRKLITSLIDQYTSSLDQCREARKSTGTSMSNRMDTHVAVLTGSTGNIGSYLLKTLMERPDISHIYCLNRYPESGMKQKIHNSQTDPTLPQDFPALRVTFLEADLSQPNLGLAKQKYQLLLKTATVVFHNAWLVDFNLPLESFRPQLAGVVELCKLGIASAQRARILFVSSISAVMSQALKMAASCTPVPEIVSDDVLSPAPVGYAESKFIAEHILSHVAITHHLSIQIARVGQVSGPVNSPGEWKRTEWFPALVLGSRFMKCLPSTLGAFVEETEDIDWIPIDVLASALADIGLTPGPEPAVSSTLKVYQLTNPYPTAWARLASVVREVLPEVRIVSSEEWLNTLYECCTTMDRSEGADEEDSKVENILLDNPALRLYDFFESKLRQTQVPTWTTLEAQRSSSSMQTLSAVSSIDLKDWVDRLCRD